MEKQYYNKIINYLMNGTVGPGETDEEKSAIVKRASKYKVIGGVLYHKGKGRGIEDLRLVLMDLSDQENAIRTCHVAEASGRHFGRNKTASLLASKYYWRMMYTDVMQYVADCPTCSMDREVLEHKSARDRTKVWKLVEVEFLENFHTTRHYTFHLLKLVDVFSKWTHCVPVHSSSERNIVGTLLEQFSSFGFPCALRFVGCKAVPATLSALQKELELFVKRANEVTPILEAAGVDADGIRTCFQDMTVHVAVEENDASLNDFASFERYLQTFQRSRGRTDNPVFHVLFGQRSVVEEPIRRWLMDKIVHLKKQNSYNWASQMPFYMFCLQNSIPPTMDRSPFSIMFNRQPPEEPLWCWYGKTQNVQVFDRPPPVAAKRPSRPSAKKKKKNQSNLIVTKKESEKRPFFEERAPTGKSYKRIRLEGEDVQPSRSSKGKTSSPRSTKQESLSVPRPTKKDNRHHPSSKTTGLLEDATGLFKSKLPSGDVATKKSKVVSFEEALMAESSKCGSTKTARKGSSSSKSSKDRTKNFKIGTPLPPEAEKLARKQLLALESKTRTPSLSVASSAIVGDGMPLSDAALESLVAPGGEILRTLCQEPQTPSTLKKRFPGRPYKKNRKYVDMATEVSVNTAKPHDSKSPSMSEGTPPSTPKVVKASHDSPKCPKPKVSAGDETQINPTRYSFRQNLKPRGPSSYVQRFIAISSSKRTSNNDSELEVLGAHPLDPVAEIIYSSEPDSAEDLRVDGIADTVAQEDKAPLEEVELPLTNGICDDDEEAELLYDSELCIDEGFLVLAEQDLQLQIQEDRVEMKELLLEDEETPAGETLSSNAMEALDEIVTFVDRVHECMPEETQHGDNDCFEDNEEDLDVVETKPISLVLNRMSDFVVNRALEGPIRLRKVTNEGIVSIFMGDLKVDQFSLLAGKRVFGNSICKRVVQRRKYVDKKPFKCSKCLRRYLDSEEELTLHMRFHDDNVEGLSCPVCKKPGSSWTLIYRHFCAHKDLTTEMEATSEKCKKLCTHCQKMFVSEEGLGKHMKTMHSPNENEPFKCGECRLTFKDPKSFRRHQEIHDDITYECGECGYTTKTHYNYILHAKFHESQRLDFAAKEGNSKVLNVVMDENGMLGCQQCNFKTSSDQDLIGHVQSCHSRVRTFYCCDHCNKKFRSQAQLCSHILMHKSQANDLFLCKLCPYKAKYKNIMTRHAKRQHPNFALKDVVQRPKNPGRPGRPSKASQKKSTEQPDGDVGEAGEGSNNAPEDDIPTATVVVRTDENGELTVCEDDEEEEILDDCTICVDSDGNFVLDPTCSGQALQFLDAGQQQQLILLEVDPQTIDPPNS